MNKGLTIKYFLYSHYLIIVFLSQLRPKGRNRVFFVKDKCFRDYICLTKKNIYDEKGFIKFYDCVYIISVPLKSGRVNY